MSLKAKHMKSMNLREKNSEVLSGTKKYWRI